MILRKKGWDGEIISASYYSMFPGKMGRWSIRLVIPYALVQRSSGTGGDT